MIPPLRTLFTGIGIAVLALTPALPARSLTLLAPGWQSAPSSPGECPVRDQDPSCYQDRTADSITLVGPWEVSPPATFSFSYLLPLTSSAQQVSFNYNYDPSGNSDSVASYQVGSNTAVNITGSGTVTSFAWDPGDTLTFSVQQVSDASWAGTLRISSFSSQDDTPPASTPVPASLPLAGAASAFAWSRSLRRRIHRHPDAAQRRA